MHLFEPSGAVARCERCGDPFDPVFGGACAECRRLLCGPDLFGSRYQRLRSWLGLEVRCVECRAGGSAPAG